MALSFDFDEYDDDDEDDDDNEISDNKSSNQESAQPVVGMVSCIMFSFHMHAL